MAERVRGTVIFWLCAVVLVTSLLLGGGTRAGFLSDVLLQLSAISLVIALLWDRGPLQRSGRFAVALCALAVLIPAIQLVPLPPTLWTQLAMRDEIVATFKLTDHTLPWMPVSLSPMATWLSALSLLPPITLFLGIRRLGSDARRRLSLVLIVVGLLGVLLGLLQIAQGAASPLRFYAFTNTSEAVGFFANRNHFAALLYSALLFAGAWVLYLPSKGPGLDARGVGLRLLGATVLITLIAGELAARSRAGLGLTMLALVGIALLPAFGAGGRQALSATRIIAAAALLSLLLATQFVLYRIFERFDLDPLDDARIDLATTTIQAAKALMPWGSGLGTFVPVYQLFERRDELAPSFANHAHNDFLELWLETGVFGFLLTGLFVLWLMARSFEAWRPYNHAHSLDGSLARAASLVILLLCLHSFVDYPLRTGAMMAVFAFSCALLVKAPERAPEDKSGTDRGNDRVSKHGGIRPGAEDDKASAATQTHLKTRQSPPETRPGTRASAPAKPHETWGGGIAWPEAWRKPSGNE